VSGFPDHYDELTEAAKCASAGARLAEARTLFSEAARVARLHDDTCRAVRAENSALFVQVELGEAQ